MKVTFDWLLLFMYRFKGRDSSLPTVNIHSTWQPIGEEVHQAVAQPCAPAPTFVASLCILALKDGRIVTVSMSMICPFHYSLTNKHYIDLDVDCSIDLLQRSSFTLFLLIALSREADLSTQSVWQRDWQWLIVFRRKTCSVLWTVAGSSKEPTTRLT